MTNNKDGRLIAQQNEMRVLRSLHRFGWLRTADIAALVWQRWAPASTGEPTLAPSIATASGLRMTQRTMRRLVDKRLVLCNRAPTGSIIYALAEAGVRQLQQIGVSANSGKDLVRSFSSTHFRHRTISNQIAISAILAGFRASSEYEIAHGQWLGGVEGIEGKKPDVLIRDAQRIWWVEVEKSRKNSRDYARLLTWLSKVGKDAFRPSGPELLGGNLRWAKVVFVCTDAFRKKLLRDLAAAGWQKNHIDALLIFSCALYKFEDILFP